jgi:hypothetical protein
LEMDRRNFSKSIDDWKLSGKNYSESKGKRLNVVAHACDPNTWEDEAKGSWIQRRQHSETLSKKAGEVRE